MNWRLAQYVFIPLLFVLTSQAQAAIPQAERDALLALYAMTDGDNWINNTGWNDAPDTECSWYGVSCDAGQNVTGLNLQANNLKGLLPAELINLTHLTSSDFRYNGVYSDSQALLDFLDATGPIGSLRDTQTLDAGGIAFANVTSNSFDVSWNPVTYAQAGGYRVYMAEQIDSDTGSVMTDFVQIADITSKTNTLTTLANLVPCRQYFIKVASYTNVHEGNVNGIESDGVFGPVMGTIPGFNTGCKLIGSPYHDVFNLISGGATVDNIRVLIAVANSGNRVYDIVYPGGEITVGSIDGASGSDDVNIVAADSITIVSDSILSAGTISIGELLTIEETLIIEETVSFEVQPISSDLLSNGSSLTYGEGFIAITAGVGSFDLAEDTAVDKLVTTVNIKFIGRDEFADKMVYQLSADNNDGVFSIDSKTGEILLAKPLDFEAIAQYQLEVSASDGGANYVGKITFNITDVAEENAAAGCTLHTGAPFDPIWLLMLILAGFHRIGRAV